MIDMIPLYDRSNSSKRFVSSGRHTTPLTEYQDLDPGDILGNAWLPLLRVPLEALNPQDGKEDVALVAESPLTPTPPRPDITGRVQFSTPSKLEIFKYAHRLNIVFGDFSIYTEGNLRKISMDQILYLNKYQVNFPLALLKTFM